MNRRRWRCRSMVAATALLIAGFTGTVGVPAPAGADTILSGEGGPFVGPVMTRLVSDATPNLNGVLASYLANGIDAGISDFVGSAPGTFGADLAVSERPLTTAEAATAKANGRTYAYVPIAATPVAVATLVTTSDFTGTDPIDPSFFCPHIKLKVEDLGAVFGIDSASIVANWADPRFSCSNGKTLSSEPVQLGANADPTMANYALMSLLDSNTKAKQDFQDGLTSALSHQGATTADTTASEHWPYVNAFVIAGGDNAFVGKLLNISATTNSPNWSFGSNDFRGFTFPISSVWTGAPLGTPWNIPTAAIINAASGYVPPSEAAAAASEGEATLSKTSDPTTNNQVTFNPSTTDAAAYNSFLMEESYLVVPTNGLAADKAKAIASIIRFALGPNGQRDIKSFGSAPATPAMVTAGLSVAATLDAQAELTAATTSTTTATSTSTTGGSTVPASGAGSGAASATGDTGGAAGTGGAGSGSGPALAFTGAPELVPVVGVGAVLVLAGAIIRRRLRRRWAEP